MLLLFVIGAILSAGRVQGAQDYPGQVVVGIVAILLLAADIVALGLGFAALFQPATKRVFGVLGCETKFFESENKACFFG